MVRKQRNNFVFYILEEKKPSRPVQSVRDHHGKIQGPP